MLLKGIGSGVLLTEYAVEMVNVSYTYPRSTRPALENVTLRIRKGEIVSILGPTGSGKTTLAYLLNGTIPHFITGGKLEGRVLVNGLDTREHSIPVLSQNVGLIFDEPEIQCLGMTVWDSIAFGPSNLGLPIDEILWRVEYALKATRLKGYEDRNPMLLSGGEKQSVAIAGALAMLPSILVFDEATSMLDPIGRQLIYSVIQELNSRYGITAILITQETGEALSLSNRLVVMYKGRIIADGEPGEVLEDYEKIKGIGVKIPQVVELFYKLRRHRLIDLSKIPITIEEAASILREHVIHRRYRLVKQTHGFNKAMDRDLAVYVEDLHYIYPNGVHALRGVNLEIYSGEFIGIVGHNGSGKTTFAKHLNGLLKPVKGRVLVYGEDTRNLSTAILSKTVGYVYQNPDAMLFRPTVEEEIAFGPRNLGLSNREVMERVEYVLKILGLEEYRDVSPGRLPRGLKKRVALGAVLSMKPRILVVDEPTAGQDWAESVEVMEILKMLNNNGVTVIVISHDIELVSAYVNRLIVFSSGRIMYDGLVHRFFTNNDVLKRASLKPPQVTELLMKLLPGLREYPITVDEALSLIEDLVRGDGCGS